MSRLTEKEFVAQLNKTSPDGCEFSVGDTVTFTNEYGVSFENRKIVGFANEPFNGRFIHLANDAWWFPVRPDQLTLEKKFNNAKPDSVIIAQWPCNELEALSSAESSVPADYVGACAVVLDDHEIVVFPNVDEASSAARLAVNLQIGGYGSAVVVAAPGKNITHETCSDWAFS